MQVLKPYWTIQDKKTGERYKMRDWDFDRAGTAEIFPIFADKSVAEKWTKIESRELELELEVIPFVHETINVPGLID